MKGLLSRVFGRPTLNPLSYEDAKKLSASPLAADRRRAAGHTGVKPEFLYLLAQDPDSTVRAAVALNEATPVQADLLLARDRDSHVREDLAQKIARLAPGLTPDEQDRVRRATYEVLEILVQDQIARVREILAEVLKDRADAPAEIVRRLAHDCEISVAGPILQYSPVLTDNDLLAIINGDPIAGARSAIARRERVTECVTDAIESSNDVDAITALLSNPSAQIREETLEKLVDRAPGVVAWHDPLARRPRLPLAAIRRLAEFVASNLLAVLEARPDLDPELKRELSHVIATRLTDEAKTSGTEGEDPIRAALKRARKLHDEGKLGDDPLAEAITARDRNFVRAALSIRSGLPLGAIDRVLTAHSAKGIVSLAWKAGLKTSLAVRLQTEFAHLNRASIMRALPDGAYPMTPDAMRWHLEFLTGIAESAA
ncbi:MAG TPA: DUF2336 domain-containing protein [Alphaproteobacteria bacterium]|nr:DUF2336 domain-containing protein [Alphaproteobacteria bacterium]